MRRAFGTPSVSNEWLRRGERDEGDRDADERERLGEGDTEAHEDLQATGSSGWRATPLDRLADDDADADGRADGGEAVADVARLP